MPGGANPCSRSWRRFTKELVRRAVLRAVERAGEVGDDDLRTSLAEMMTDGGALARVLLGGAEPAEGHRPIPAAGPGFASSPGAGPGPGPST